MLNDLPPVKCLNTVLASGVQYPKEVGQYCLPDPKLKFVQKVHHEHWIEIKPMLG